MWWCGESLWRSTQARYRARLRKGPWARALSFLHIIIISPVTIQKLDHGTFMDMSQGSELASHSCWAGLR